MIIFPLLVLSEDDLKPFIDAYRKQLKDDREFRIVSIVPVTNGDQFTVEIKAEPVAPVVK